MEEIERLEMHMVCSDSYSQRMALYGFYRRCKGNFFDDAADMHDGQIRTSYKNIRSE